MKLYATTTSERAMKGQGGNKMVNIALYIEDRKNPRFRMFVTSRDDGSTDVVLSDMNKPFPNQVFQENIKGEKKKGECSCCGEIGGRHSDDACEPYRER